MKHLYLITCSDEPICIAPTRISAMNAMFMQAAKHMVSFPDFRDYEAEIKESPDKQLTLTVTIKNEDAISWIAKITPVNQDESFERNLTAHDFIERHIQCIER